MVNGAKPFKAIFTGLNSEGEPLMGVWVMTASMEEVEPMLRKLKENIDKMGGRVSRFVCLQCDAAHESVKCGAFLLLLYGFRFYGAAASEDRSWCPTPRGGTSTAWWSSS